jgi:hypothetical protein
MLTPPAMFPAPLDAGPPAVSQVLFMNTLFQR